jgi:hypothetical protein
MEHNKDKLAFPAKVDQDYFKGGCGALMLNICHTYFSKENQVQTYMHARIKFHAYSDISE